MLEEKNKGIGIYNFNIKNVNTKALFIYFNIRNDGRTEVRVSFQRATA
jgi:hypothetical protein